MNIILDNTFGLIDAIAEWIRPNLWQIAIVAIPSSIVGAIALGYIL